MHSSFASRVAGFCLAAALLVARGIAPSAAQDLKTWRHGIIEAKSDAGFVLMASRRGFAEKQGLHVEILQVKSDTFGLKALLAGELDSYEGGPGGAIVAASRGADIKIIGCHWPMVVHGVFVRDTVATVADLKGKSIAISAPGAMPDLLVRAVLEKNGISPSEVRFANLGSDVDRFKALSAGVTDAAVISTEYVPVAPPGIRLLVASREVMPNFIRDETLELTREVAKLKADDPRPGFIFDEAVKYKHIDPDMPIPMDKIAWMKAELEKSAKLPPFDLAKLVDMDVRARALELAGK